MKQPCRLEKTGEKFITILGNLKEKIQIGCKSPQKINPTRNAKKIHRLQTTCSFFLCIESFH
jgi:hypothetical protein